MTREEKQKAIYVLKKSAPVFPLKKPEEYNDYVQAIKQVIDWLEQEPFINKPCVSSEVCEHDKNVVLDKISNEILEKCFDVTYKNQAFDYGLKIVKWSDVREILDKYKVESEDKE